MLDGVNQDQALSALRTILTMVGTFLISRGWISGDTWATVAGLIVAVAPGIWGILVHTTTSKVAAVEALPNVKQIVINSDAPIGGPLRTLANDDSHEKVVMHTPPPNAEAVLKGATKS